MSRRAALAAVALVAALAVDRLAVLGQPLTYDQVTQRALNATFPVADLLAGRYPDARHPPLGYLVLAPFAQTSLDEAWIRLPTVGASPTVAKQPKPGGSFAFQMPNIPATLDPYTVTSYQTAYLNGLSYSKLLRFKAGVPEVAPADNSMEPDIAEKLPEQQDDLHYTFKLKPNVKFHNGRALTSEDVRYAFDRYLNYDKSVHKTGLSFIDKMETPDASTFNITTKVPYADTSFYLGGNLGA